MNDEFELVPFSSSDSSSPETPPTMVMTHRTRICCVCGSVATKTLEEDTVMIRVLLPCACQPSEKERCEDCLRAMIEHTGSLLCKDCGAPYRLEPKVGKAKWNVRHVRWGMRIHGIVDVLFLLLILHCLVIPLFWITTRWMAWTIALPSAYVLALTIDGFLLYLYYAIQMIRHRSCIIHPEACRSCAVGNGPFLTYPESCSVLYAFFLIGTPPVLFLFCLVIAIAILNRRARQYYARRTMEAFVIRGL